MLISPTSVVPSLRSLRTVLLHYATQTGDTDLLFLLDYCFSLIIVSFNAACLKAAVNIV